ncbi:hypothetical protein [Enterobacter ludwigii]|uniref:hypothetical protein n=1 Tax=Enterobacter ludwigii TaxID=299767 RepID=UPI003D6F2919
MSTITKERVAGIANGEKCYTHDDVVELARIALASLEAEESRRNPVLAYADSYRDMAKQGVESIPVWSVITDLERNIAPLYTAPPAPVSVPDAATAIRACMEEFPESVYDIVEECAAIAESACRAAMLQGAEPVTTAYKLPFEQWLSQQGERIEIDCGCVSVEVFMHWLRMAYGAGNSPVIPDCSCRTCRPVTFTDSRFVVCHECGNKRCPHANDHRNACTGSNEPGQEGSAYPAAPQQEVKHG